MANRITIKKGLQIPLAEELKKFSWLNSQRICKSLS